MPVHHPQQRARFFLTVCQAEFPLQLDALWRPAAQGTGDAQGRLTDAGDSVEEGRFRQQGKLRCLPQRSKGGIVVDPGKLRACLIGMVRGLL